MSLETYSSPAGIYRQTQERLAASRQSGGLWQAYKQKPRDTALRDELILRYAPLVKYVAGRLSAFLPPGFDGEDLLSHGTVGLIEAVDRYDPDQGTKFESFAVQRIRGAMIDALRQLSLLPRATVRQVRALDEAVATLEGELGRAPTTTELAQRLGLDERSVGEVTAAANLSLLSIESTTIGGEESSLTLLDTLAGDAEDFTARLEKKELVAALAQAIDRLPKREKLVLALYYNEELTLKEIGKVLGVTESRVSQLHSAALSRLRTALAPRHREATRLMA
jgi:RNA polymerase sigma factor for flagellar operon FliA